MPTSTAKRTLTVALLGNPNTGKSTLFTALVGIRQRVGNYPGVTVEKKTGQMEYAGARYELVDLPGLYSLAARSRDEMVAVDLMLGRLKGTAPVDAVVCIVDAANLPRNLYLLSQVLEFGLPTVVALNMIDVAADRGVRVDAARLAERLGVPVVPVQANRRIGVGELRAALAGAIERHVAAVASPLPEAVEKEVRRLAPFFTHTAAGEGAPGRLPRCLLQRLLLDAEGYLERVLLVHGDGSAHQALALARARLVEAGCGVPGVEPAARYEWIRGALEGVLVEPKQFRTTASDRIDRVLTHRLWGTIFFVLLMVVVFQAVFVWARPMMDAIDAGASAVGGWVQAWMAPGALESLLVDGVIGGVGGVLVFLPQILILFLFIGILEDCGYMGRAAYLMDRLMVRVGLSGKSFIPMLSSFACAIPGIMAARVIEDERDRLTTIVVAPLLTCSARLPIYAMLIAAFVPPETYLGGRLSLQGLTLLALYVLGIGMAVVVALVLKRTILRGSTPAFVMELPSYKWPSVRTVAYRVAERAWLFLRCAGTMILAVSIIVWAALYYPHDAEEVEGPFRPQARQVAQRMGPIAQGDAELETVRAELSAAEGPLGPAIAAGIARIDELSPASGADEEIRVELARLDHEIAGAYQRQSLLGQLGRSIEPVFRPLGWDWRIGAAVIAAFPAREIVVATLGVIYNLGEDVESQTEEGTTQLHRRLRSVTWDGTDRKVFNLPVALSIMVFFALCAQCAATLAVIKRETNSWRWPLFTFTYMTVLAYVGAMLTYQVGMWIAGA